MARCDGRKNRELRPVKVYPHYVKYPHGSVLIETGITRVLCTAMAQEGVPRFLRGKGRGWVTAEYGMLPASTPDRSIRPVARGRPDGRAQEIQRLIGRALRAVTDMDKLGERTIWVDCDVLQADGGTRTASVTGAFLAVDIAVRKIIEEGIISEYPMRENIAAISAGIVGGRPMLDLCYSEDCAADVDMNVVMTESGRFIEIQGTAEGKPYTKAELDKLLELAKAGIKKLIRIQKKSVRP